MKDDLSNCVRAALFAALVFPSVVSAENWSVAEHEGRMEVRGDAGLVLAWQSKTLANPIGGEKFGSSAFLHSLRTPSGFEWTTIQPADHLHHLGLWWPWKYIEVDGAKYNCWEIQEGQGAHTAKSVKSLTHKPGRLEWEFLNETVIKKTGGEPIPVINETAKVCLTKSGDSQVLDISIQQKAAKAPVKIVEYRYSGFSWRGPASWNKDNSTMTTSEGKGRDDANGVPARWVVVSGPTPKGSASVLMMSAAADASGILERLRVWDSNAHNGAPFVNFNPVMEKALPLDENHPAVASRNYRVIAADHVIDAAAAEAEWKKWLKK